MDAFPAPLGYSQPVYAQVDASGCLIQADEAIMRLHVLAGGDAGGYLAIPALAAIASATRSMKMRMARSVQVATAGEDVALWVESQLIDDIVQLKITGWRPVDPPYGANEPYIADDNSVIHLIFDRNLRLLSESGLPQETCVISAIGCGAFILFPADLASNTDVLCSMELHSDFVCDNAMIAGNAYLYAVTGRAEKDTQNVFTGYFVELRRVYKTDEGQHTQDEPIETLLGKQLGSALRQPLRRIIANAETIGNKLQGPIRENYAVYAKDIADAARHLVALVDDLGDLEAVERADFRTSKDQIELGDIARRVAGLLALKAADRDIAIHTPDESITVPATAEFRRVLQIVINLVTNALRYSPQGTQITISIGQNERFASLTVTDQGDGINIDDQNKIFEKFERLGRSGDGGSGLGLYISRTLARAMGGDLTVTTPEHGGAQFILHLPRIG
jgi:two-component sensor histidine kinase